MADEISRVEYYVAAVPHKVGEGARVLTAFKEAGINLSGLLGYRKTARKAEIIVIVEEKTPGVGAAGKKSATRDQAAHPLLFVISYQEFDWKNVGQNFLKKIVISPAAGVESAIAFANEPYR
jgi:hypothetical protein